jgi:nucleotide-binding universal stress UspA family protein
MLDHVPSVHPRRHSIHPPFPRILCAVDGGEGSDAAIEQALAVADGDARVAFAASWYGAGSPERAAVTDQQAREMVERAVARARDAGVEARPEYFHAPRLGDALLRAAAGHDLVVVGAHPHARAPGIVLGETATLLAHRSPVPVLIARERALDAGVVVGTRARPADRAALTAATHLAARLGAELTVVHVAEHGGNAQHPELSAELANARALLGRELDYLTETGPAARAIVFAAEGDGAGLVVVGSSGRKGLSSLTSVSERVAHLAPCSVLVMRGK